MSDQVNPIFYGAVVGTFTLLGIIVSFVLERWNRKRDLYSQNARESLERLYSVLMDYIERHMDLIEPFSLDESEITHIIDIIYDQRIFATSDLMKMVHEVELTLQDNNKSGIGNHPENIRDIDWRLYNAIREDFYMLQRIAGFEKSYPILRTKYRMIGLWKYFKDRWRVWKFRLESKIKKDRGPI